MNIYESIVAIMQEIPAIGKEKRNQQQGFMYRGVDDVMNALQPLLSKHKVFAVPEVLEQTREERTTGRGGTLLYSLLKIKYTFYAEDGSSVSAVVIGEGMDSGDKASNKAMAVALKYAFFQLFCIPTEEMTDPDSETPEPSKPKGAEHPRGQETPKSSRSYGHPANPNDFPVRVCEQCAQPIKAVRHNGKEYSAEEIAAQSNITYHKELCWNCMKVLNAQKQAGEANENAG